MTQPSFIDRIAQRRGQGGQKPRADHQQVAALPRRDSGKTPSRRATITVPMPVAQTVAELLAVLATDHQLSPITLSSTPTKKELLAILESRTLEVLDAVNGHP